MKKQRIYIDTSVVGGCFDEEFSEWSLKLFDLFLAGEMIPVVSALTRIEMESAPDRVQRQLELLRDPITEDVVLTPWAKELADRYIKRNVLSSKHIVDAQHIAIATVEAVDVLVSWNFKHVVNYFRIRGYNAVNMELGFRQIEIRSPREVLYEKDL